MIAVILALIIIVSPVHAEWINSSKKGHVGWYGYEVKKQSRKKKKTAGKVQKKPAVLSWPSPDKLYHMKVSEIRKWIDKAADQAISHPTEQNIKRWIEYMKVADRKATEFSGMWAWVMQNNPNLYREAALYPSVNPGSRAYWKAVWQSVKNALAEKGSQYALLFFHSSDPFSKAQKQILDEFTKENPGWSIKEIALTPPVAQKFNIQYAPQIWLLPKTTKKPIPLAAGVISLNRLEKRIYHTILVLEGHMPPQLAPYQPFKVQSKGNEK